jgi:hypothetical protein
MNIIHITNKYGHKQAIDTDNGNNECCSECGRCYINFGNGTSCETCQTDALDHCEQIY